MSLSALTMCILKQQFLKKQKAEMLLYLKRREEKITKNGKVFT